MSSQWHGGKGDKERVSDYRKYRENYDNIFSKNKQESKEEEQEEEKELNDNKECN